MPRVDLSEGSGPVMPPPPLLVMELPSRHRRSAAEPDALPASQVETIEGPPARDERRFVKGAPELLKTIRSSIARGDAQALEVSVCSLENLAKGLDARILEAEAHRLKLLARDRDLEGAGNALPDLEDELESLLETLEGIRQRATDQIV